MTTKLQTTTRERLMAQHENGRRVEYLLNGAHLPAPIIIPHPDCVHVTVADVHDFGPWLELLGGKIHVSPEFEGVEMWNLHTQTEPYSDGTTVAVIVSAPLPAGESVMHDIRSEVAR